MPTVKDWACAISLRISDEWDGKDEWPEDVELLRKTLYRLLSKNPKECRRLIGSGIIEEDYFAPLT
ncbi:MAG: hypothetical protein FJY83_05300 [Candidatus Aminicenantes bacterium]|nr:hypothetical protein [Candidatus Aminicenantes bacterium]